jgi:hypothetical protein
MIVAILTLDGEGEIFGKEVASSRRDFAKPYHSFSGKGLVMSHLTTNLQRGASAMKTRNIVIRCLVLLMLITSTTTIFMACASTSTQESTGQYVDDSVITSKVKSLLANDDFFKSFKISVETYKGTVQLSGFVNSQKAADKAGEIARSVKGVKNVKNNLIVK